VEPDRQDRVDPQDLLHLAAVALLDGERKYTPIDVCERAGVDHATADSLWRAMGFPDVPDDQVAFTDRDVAALKAAVALPATGTLDAVGVRQQARVMSQAVATIAAAHLEFADGQDRDPERLSAFVIEVLPTLDDLLVYLYRRHLLAAVERSVLLERDHADRPLPTLAVGFADLVGFTRVANQIDEAELSELVEGFNGAAADVVAEGGGRVVKMLGDEIMFTATDPVAASLTALRLVDEVGDHNGLPPLRAGVAAGVVILRHGDVFGSTVNLAHRLVDVARPGTVLIDEAVHAAVEPLEEVEAQRVHAIRRLRGFDRVRVWSIRGREPT
jgi:adenylate cyclase